jgi:hypothetical protein
MSAAEHTGQTAEQRSSVKIATTAKGDPTVEVKVYEGTSEDELERIRQLAVHNYLAVCRELGIVT